MSTNVTNFSGNDRNELIRISDQNGKQAVSARELHNFLGSKKDFSSWIKDRIEKYGFIEQVDFELLTNLGEQNGRGGHNKIEYALNIDCAKEIAMVEGNEKGRQARQYFIEIEKKFKNSIVAFQNDPFIQLRMNQIQQQEQIQILETKVNLIEAKSATRPDYFSVMGYAILNKITVGLTIAASIGRKSAAICKKNGFPTDEVPDPRFGKVKLYPRNVLEVVFNETMYL